MNIIQNIGQCDLSFPFYCISSTCGIYFTESKISIIYPKDQTSASIKFINSNSQVNIDGLNKTKRITQLITKDAIKTCFTDIPTYEGLIYKNLWNKIDLIIKPIDGKLIFEYLVHTGADISNIKVKYDGSKEFSKVLTVTAELSL